MPNKLLAYSRLKPGEIKTFDVPFYSRTFASGCDIDKAIGTFCVMYPVADGFAAEVQQFPNSPTGCQAALSWVWSYAQKYVPANEKPILIIESTGPYHVLTTHIFEQDGRISVIVVNPVRVKALLRAEGKDDVKDAVTLTKLALSFDIKRSVLAVGIQQQLRKTLRLRRKLIQGRTQVSNRIGTLLTENSVPLPNVMKIMSVSGLAFCNAIANGETSPDLLMTLWQGRGMSFQMKDAVAKTLAFRQVLAVAAPDLAKAEIERLKEIYDALRYVPDLAPSCRWLLSQQLRLLDTFQVEIEAINQQLEQLIDQYQITLPGGTLRTAREAIQLALTAPVVTEEAARVLIAEAGLNFPEIYGTAEAFCKQLGLTAGNQKSAGKVVGRGVTPGNKHFKPIIVQAVTSFLRRQLPEDGKGRYLWSWGRSYQARSDAQHARIAVAHKLTASLFFMFRAWQPYDDSQHILSSEAHTVKTARRLANISRELTTKDGFVNREAAAELRQAAKVINTTLGIHTSAYRLKQIATDAPVNTLALPTRALKALHRNDITTLSQLVLQLIAGNLLGLSGIGDKIAQAIETALIEAGYIEKCSDPVSQATTLSGKAREGFHTCE